MKAIKLRQDLCMSGLGLTYIREDSLDLAGNGINM